MKAELLYIDQDQRGISVVYLVGEISLHLVSFSSFASSRLIQFNQTTTAATFCSSTKLQLESVMQTLFNVKVLILDKLSDE